MFSYVSPEQRVRPTIRCGRFAASWMRRFGRCRRSLIGSTRPWGVRRFRPERLLCAQLLQVFYSIRSERLLMEQLDYNILFRWFVGMELDEPIWAPTVFTKNRDRLLTQDVALSFFRRVIARRAVHVGRALHR
jgi:hypothetical protein